MGQVREILEREPPPILYHYTSQLGLLGIVEKKEIWASHTQYLNDYQEFKHALEIGRQMIEELRRDVQHSAHHNILDQMRVALDSRHESINVCVCSFSEKGDVLSQWRAYGGSSGFSIGFSGPFLRRVTDKIEFFLVPCVYLIAEQRDLMRRLLESVIDEILEWRTRQNPPTTINRGGNLLAYLNRYAPILKHESFSEEAEWRIISCPLMCGMNRFGYRPGVSMLVPYYKIPLHTEHQPFEIQRLFVGPTPHRDESKSSVEGLLITHGLEHEGVVHNSAAPYRNW